MGSIDGSSDTSTESAAAKVLFIVSGATYWVLKDGTRYATGYWAEEFANPYKILTDAGHEVVVATPNGVTPNVDMMSLRPEMVGGNDARARARGDHPFGRGDAPAAAAVRRASRGLRRGVPAGRSRPDVGPGMGR